MDKKTLQEWIRTGREIEFEVNGVNYSLTNFMEGNEVYLSFCEFYKETLDVKDFDTLWNSTYKGMKFSDLWESVRYDDITLY